MRVGEHSSWERDQRALEVHCDDDLELAWSIWLDPSVDKVHIDYRVEGADLSEHMQTCFGTAVATVRRVQHQLPTGFAPADVLDLGSSVGFNSLALQAHYPAARILGIDPDARAVGLADVIAARAQIRGGERRPDYMVGRGEKLPYPDEHFDLVVSITVIEHVDDVEACVAEAARVLRPGGYLYVEAPNYLWPFEPHIGVVMPPLCPKPLLRLLARLQGQAQHARYVDHLKFVHPRRVERAFAAAGLQWVNLFEGKLVSAFEHGDSAVMHYGRLARLARVLNRLGLGRSIRNVVVATGFYPSVLYLARKA